MFLTISLSQGATLDEAKKVYLSGDYEAALPLLEEQYNKNKSNASVNQWIGVCLFNLNRISEATKYFEFAKSKRVVEAYKYLALIAFYDYNFEKGSQLLGQYKSEMTRLKKSLSDDVSELENRMLKAKVMLNHVEKIAIIDSIVVDKDEFFKYYCLSQGVGTLKGQEILPFHIDDSVSVVFMPESKSRMMWGMATFVSDEDTIKRQNIYEMQKLYGGNWDSAIKLDDAVNIDGDSSYPFMLTDGTTLYYANNGSESIGGYDIFISRKDTGTGKYYPPQNIGMPFNSPFDDYMLVIDEFTGVGWWATDRNQIPGKVTIYVYIPNDVRVNYSPEDPNLTSYAKIENIEVTWDGNNYLAKLQEIKSLTQTKREEQRQDFIFHLKNGVKYTRFDQFKSTEARHHMEELVAMQQKQLSDEERLKRLRQQYSKVSGAQRSTLRNEILKLENAVDSYPEKIEQIANIIRKLEIK